MYSDNTKFSIKDMIIQFLFIALFIFILIWLFPLKSDLKNLEVTTVNENSNNEVLYDRVFNENILSMKESAKSYYTTPRLPKNVNDKVKMTLGEMLEKKIILPFVDKNGDACSLTDSYVEITKYDEEFVMKVNLSCGDQENYLLVYMGCYDYCETAICEKNQKDVKAPTIYSGKVTQPVKQETKPAPVVNNYYNNVVNNVINNVTNNTTINNVTNNYVTEEPKPEPTPEPTPEPEKPTVEYLYEYSKTTDGKWKESDWSEWSTKEVTASSTRAVQIKTVTKKVLKGYNVTYGPDYNKPIYGTKEVVYGTKTETYCKEWGYVKTGKYTYSGWKDAGLVTLYYVPTSTETVKYEYVRSGNESCTTNCSSTTYRIYRKYVREKIAEQQYKCLSEGTRTVNLTTTVKVITGYEKKVIKKDPVYEEVKTKYYRYKTREYIGGTTDKKWSVYNDTTLLNAGYSYTGNKKVK